MIDTGFVRQVREAQRRCAERGQKTIGFGGFHDAFKLPPYNPIRYQKEKTMKTMWTPGIAYPPGTAVRLPNYFPYTELRTRPMKPGPYKSTTHGNITLSERGRLLLAAERDAAQGAIRAGNFSTDNLALSRARGDIARYISHLERFPVAGNRFEQRNYLDECERECQKDARQQAARLDALLKDLTDPSVWGPVSHSFDTIGRDLDLAVAEPAKETSVTNQKNTEQTTPAEKTRSHLIAESTQELLAAQRDLEMLANVPAGTSDIYISTHDLAHHPMAVAVSTLVSEQWAALSKKALARAKARVAKAEKAVAALLP